MKIIDKYIIRQYSAPLFYSFITFFMMFVVFDLFENLSEFLEKQIPLSHIVKYYSFALPAMLVFIMPVSLLLAVLYTMYQFTRHNELTALRASGVSMHRIVMPFVFVGIAASVLLGFVNEFVAPDASYWAYQFMREQGVVREEDVSSRYVRNLPYKNEAQNRIWAIDQYDRDLFDMKGVSLVQSRPDGSDLRRIVAEEAKWLDGEWWFFDVTVREFDEASNPKGPVKQVARMDMSHLTETPLDFEIVTKRPEFKSSRELWLYYNAHPHLSSAAKAMVLVDMHSRMAMPWSCLIVMLFGMPSGVFTGRKGAMAGILLALGTFFGFFILMTLFSWMGKTELLPPALSAWFPNLLFLSIGLWWMRKLA